MGARSNSVLFIACFGCWFPAVIAAAVAFVFAAAAAHVVSFDEPLAGLWLKHCGGLRQHISAQWRPPHSIMGKTKSKQTSGQVPSNSAGGISPSVGGVPTLTPQQQQVIDENRRAALDRRRERERRGNQDEPQQTQNQAGAPPAVAANDLKCPICLQDLGGGREEEITALPCAHPFHTSCINTYMESTGKTFETACPFKCHRSSACISAAEEMDLTAQGLDEVMEADREDLQAAANALADAAREFLGQ